MAQPGQAPPQFAGPGPGGPGGPPIQLQPGQQPTPEQIRQMQAQIAVEAQKAGLTVPQYIERVKAQAMQQHQMRQRMMAQQQQAQQQGQPVMQQQQGAPQQGQQQGAQPGQQVPIQPGPPKPEALAVANFLKAQDLKPRTCIFQEKRKDMFKVKRAIRALHSDAYAKARKKNPLLPEVKDRVTAENTFKLLPLSLLALRVSKIDPHEGHNHAPAAKKKRTKGLWTVKVEPQQEAQDQYHYVWLYEGSQWKNKLYAVGALALILAVVFFPVWPYHLRLGVWYLSMAMLGVLGLFFAMAIFRLILFLVTMFAAPPGFWLFPNLFEDVGFFDSFKPVGAWHEDEKAVKQRKKAEKQQKKERREAKASGKGGKGESTAKAIEAAPAQATESVKSTAEAIKEAVTPSASNSAPEISQPVTASATGTESAPTDGQMEAQQRNLSARVEEVEDD